MRVDKHTYDTSQLVIGGGLNALLYSYFTGHPCIFINPCIPFRFDECEAGFEFNFLHLETKNLQAAWQRLNVLLSLSNQMPLSDKAASITVQDNILRVVTKDSRLVKFNFEKLIVFDDNGINGLPLLKKEKVGKTRVIDWFDVKSGMEHTHDKFRTSSDFVSEVIFYPSDRFGIQKTERVRKDLVAISYLDEGQVDNFDFSGTMAKFKIVSLMKENGIKGARNGRDTYNPSLYRYYSPKIEHMERQKISEVIRTYQKNERFEFKKESPEKVIENFFCEPDTYAAKINKYFLDTALK